MTLAQAVLEIFLTSFHWVMMSKTEKEDNSVMDFENFTKS